MIKAGSGEVTSGSAVGLGAWRGALAGGSFAVVPTVVSGTHPGTLFYTLPVATVAGSVMGAVCGALALAVVTAVQHRHLAHLAAGGLAAAAWIARTLAARLDATSTPAPSRSRA